MIVWVESLADNVMDGLNVEQRLARTGLTVGNQFSGDLALDFVRLTWVFDAHVASYPDYIAGGGNDAFDVKLILQADWQPMKRSCCGTRLRAVMLVELLGAFQRLIEKGPMKAIGL